MKGQFFGLKSDMNGPMMPEVVPMLKEGSVTRGSLRPESPLCRNGTVIFLFPFLACFV